MSGTHDLHGTAQGLLALGFSVIPVDHRTKQPSFPLLPRDPVTAKPTWKPFRQRQPTAEELDRWFGPTNPDSAQSIAVVGGFGGLVCLDFDVVRFYTAWQKRVGTLADGLPVQETGGGRRQVFFRSEQPGPNQELAWVPDEHEPSGRKIAIETRGEGGYALVPPSLHPKGKRYRWLSGDLSSVPLLPPAHAEALIEAARKLDECPHTRQEQERIAAQACEDHQRRSAASRNGSTSVINAFNQAHPIEGVLEQHGYTARGDRYVRPGGTSASVSIRECRSCHFSTNDPLNDGKVKTGIGVHDAFDLYAFYEHQGDVKSAVRSAAALMGMARASDPAPQQANPGHSEPDASDERRAAQQVPPTPLDVIQVPPLPSGVFTGWLGDMIDAVAQCTETPPDVAALFALGTLSTAVQGLWSVRPQPDYFEPLSSFCLLVMESGNRKTAVQSAMTRPLVVWERELAARSELEVKRIESERKTLEMRIKRLRDDAAKEKGEVRFQDLSRQIAEMEASMPLPPTVLRLFTEDVTAEHLGTMLSDNGERLAVLSDEGGIFDLMAGRYSNGIPNIEIYLKGHSGSAVRVDRGTRTPVVLSRPALSICCSPQPEVLRSLTKIKGFRGRGLLARFWYAMPPSRVGYRTLAHRPVPEEVSAAYERHLRSLLSVTAAVGDDGRPVPRTLSLSGGAWGVWKQLQRETELMLRPGGRLADLKDWGSKFPGAVARIAGLLHLAEHAADPLSCGEITTATMQWAVKLGWYLVEHALAAFDVMGAAEGMEAARLLWAVIEKNQRERSTAREAWHPLRGGEKLRTMEQANAGFQVLVDHGYLYDPEPPSVARVGRPSRFLLVHPQIVATWKQGRGFGHSGQEFLKKSNDESSSSVYQNTHNPDSLVPQIDDQNDQNLNGAPQPTHGPISVTSRSPAARPNGPADPSCDSQLIDECQRLEREALSDPRFH